MLAPRSCWSRQNSTLKALDLNFRQNNQKILRIFQKCDGMLRVTVSIN